MVANNKYTKTIFHETIMYEFAALKNFALYSTMPAISLVKQLIWPKQDCPAIIGAPHYMHKLIYQL